MEHITLLERREITPQETQITDAAIDRAADGGDQLLLSKVEKLGYTPQSLKMHRRLRKGNCAQATGKDVSLARELRALGIKPFTTESVESYKRAKCRGRFQIFERTLAAADLFAIIVFGALLNGIILHFLGNALVQEFPVLLFSDSLRDPSSFVITLEISPFFWGLGVFFVASRTNQNEQPFIGNIFEFLCFGSLGWIMHLFGSRNRLWQLVWLKNYEKDVPRHVLQTIVLINTRCPSAEFFVDEFVNKPDPFLMLTLGLEEYYVEVWNEPRFSEKRIA